MLVSVVGVRITAPGEAEGERGSDELEPSRAVATDQKRKAIRKLFLYSENNGLGGHTESGSEAEVNARRGRAR